ncbi:MAG TPA: hypothetical protein VK141_11320 [Nitrosomonas sp.]|nr:hypothetical protein [Nitrosomonas sp.]
MRKILFLLFAMFSYTPSQAQYFIRIGSGYNLDLGGAYLGDSHYYFYGNKGTQEAIYGSYGSGFHFDCAIDTKINDNLLAEIGFSYLKGRNHDIVTKYGGEYPSEHVKQLSSRVFSLTPALIITAQLGALKPYSRFGVTISLPKQLEEEHTQWISMGTIRPHSSIQTDWGGVALGFSGSLGVMVPVGAISIYGEVCATSMEWRPTNWKSEIDGITKEGDYQSIRDIRPDEYITLPMTPSHPFGSLGLNVGVLLSL